MSRGRARSTAHWDPPCRDNSAPVPPSCWPRWFPSLTQKQEHIWEHTRGSHRTVPGSGCGPKRRKEGKDRDTRVREEREGGTKLPLCKPPLPTAHSAHWKWEPMHQAGEFQSHVRDSSTEPPGPGAQIAVPAPMAAPAPVAPPLPGRKTSTGGSLSDCVRLRLSPQPPSCSTSSTEGGRLPGTSQERGPSAPSTPPWGLTARVGQGFPCEEAPQAPPAPLMVQECQSDWPRSQGPKGHVFMCSLMAQNVPITPLSPHPCRLWVLTEHQRPILKTQRPVCPVYSGCALTRTPVVSSLVQGKLMAWKALLE